MISYFIYIYIYIKIYMKYEFSSISRLFKREQKWKTDIYQTISTISKFFGMCCAMAPHGDASCHDGTMMMSSSAPPTRVNESIQFSQCHGNNT